jgi:hypothetical protein
MCQPPHHSLPRLLHPGQLKRCASLAAAACPLQPRAFQRQLTNGPCYGCASQGADGEQLPARQQQEALPLHLLLLPLPLLLFLLPLAVLSFALPLPPVQLQPAWQQSQLPQSVACGGCLPLPPQALQAQQRLSMAGELALQLCREPSQCLLLAELLHPQLAGVLPPQHRQLAQQLLLAARLAGRMPWPALLPQLLCRCGAACSRSGLQ